MSELAAANPGVERFYIHADSFRELAGNSTPLAFDVGMALASMRVARIADHHMEQAVDLGVFSESEGARVTEWLTDQCDVAMGGLLRASGYAPNIPYRPGPFQRVLRDEQTINNTCFADGYYTIATTPEASTRMFADNERLPDVTRSLSDTGEPSDLVIIRGDNLVFLDDLTPEEQQRRKYGRPDPLSVDKVCQIDATCRDVYDDQVREHLAKWWVYYAVIKENSRWHEENDINRADILVDIAGASSRVLQQRSLSCRQSVAV